MNIIESTIYECTHGRVAGGICIDCRQPVAVVCPYCSRLSEVADQLEDETEEEQRHPKPRQTQLPAHYYRSPPGRESPLRKGT